MFKNPRTCLYQSLGDNIHYYTFRESSRRAVSEFADLLSYTLEEYDSQCVTLLLDIRQSGLPPVMHMSNVFKRLLNNRSQVPPLRIAVVYREGSLLSAGGGFMIPQRTGDSVRMMQEDVSSALAWLHD